MKRLAASIILACLVSGPSSANQVVWPPLTPETFVGVWEAIFPDRGHLLHMEIRARGDSYLTWVTVGPTGVDDWSCWRLVASDIKNGVVKLQFGKACGGGSATALPELWIVGTGTGIDIAGAIDAQFCGRSWPDSPPARAESFGVVDSKHMFFRKGTWTRDFALASQAAENRIKELASHER